ncbi:MAG TPA: hypothetical protein VHA06_09145, partial [Candidatus Angelobacter sp.]|nr:hypothetical protein [Candidatus Angelobacter sp.]
MKSVFAILFSFLLIATQTAFMAGAVNSTPQPGAVQQCCCAHCPRHCCIAKDVPTPESPPITPTRTVSQTDWQVLLAVTQHIFDHPLTEVSPSFPSDSPAPSLGAIPLYQR